MTKEERCKYYKHFQGFDAWHISSVDGKVLTLNDGPCGVRKPALDDFNNQNGILEAIACLSPAAIAASFSSDVAYKNGQILGNDCISKKVDVLLAPGVNIKRSALCGRNFEYFSEDPILSGKLASSYIDGVQDCGVRTCLKHYCANNKEWARKICSSELSLKALNEVYLRPFSYVFEHTNPFSVMTSYNRVNGEYVPESNYLFNKKLKQDFKFKGLIISDWCAVNDKIATIRNGLHVEMPLAYRGDDYYEKEFASKKFTEKDLIRNDLEFLNATKSFKKKVLKEPKAVDKLHEECVEIANEVPILVKNNNYLPLSKTEKVLFIGYSVSNQRIVGDGSASVNPIFKKTMLNILIDKKFNFEFVRGADENDRLATNEQELSSYKNKVSKVVLFLSGLKNDESENQDRNTIEFRKSQIELFNLVKKVFGKFATVIISGSVYNIKNIYENSDAVVINYFSGEGQSEAILNCLYGDSNFSGRLPETWISSLEQNPIYKELKKQNIYYEYYDEDIFVGYKFYLKEQQNDFILPFGYGLSYSNFTYDNYSIYVKNNVVVLGLDIRNNSDFDGKDVIQIYVGKTDSNVYRAKYELKAFEKVFVGAHSYRHVSIKIPVTDLSVYDSENDSMVVEKGKYQFYINKNAFAVSMKLEIDIDGVELKKDEILSLIRKDLPKGFSLLSPCEKFMQMGIEPLTKFLETHKDIDKVKLINFLQWNCAMPFNELMWMDVIRFDQMLEMIDFYNKLDHSLVDKIDGI